MTMPYTAPIRDLMFAATELADLGGVGRLPGYEDATPALLQTILEEAGKFAGEVLAPLNASGDRQGATLQDGVARTADGWQDAYRQFTEGGWNGLPFDPAHGGGGLPWLAATAVAEIWHAANMAFSLCPLLTQAAIEAIETHGDAQQRATYLPKLVSGEWAGTMNLTEPQAGSDLAAVQCRAVPSGDHYLINGQKIFITYGEHDLTDNIVHLVLARTPDAPAGVRGISLFIVPKFLPDDDGEWRAANDIETVSLEHKLGLHASPTAALAYGGQGDGAVGYLVGEENRGLMYMFTMMNLARHAIGVQGNGVSERAYQQAAAYASQRIQGRALSDVDGDDHKGVPIIDHADIKRMLLLQKCRIEALRALGLVIAGNMDHERRQLDEQARTEAREMVEVMIPIFKGYATELGVENVSLALQVHGGMGFIEQTGVAQYYRDQRITPIYEGTTGIQAMDLIGRKLTRDHGAMNARIIERIRQDCAALTDTDDMAVDMLNALDGLNTAAATILRFAAADMNRAAAVSEPYLRLWGVVACGWQMLKAADISISKLAREADDEDDDFYRHKLRTAQFYFSAEMPKAAALVDMITASADFIVYADADFFATR